MEDSQGIPLLHKLIEHKKKNPISFHVPGHKNGQVFPTHSEDLFKSILSIDLTEITELDDLYAPEGAIKQAQILAAEWFQVDASYFLVNGSTVGNLIMIMATCGPGDLVLVQRNCHKSILNGLELSGAKPIFLTPEYDTEVNRYGAPSTKTLEEAIHKYTNIKALILTYPDYFGRTYPLKEKIELAHAQKIPVLIDEAHGVHFSLPFIDQPSAIELGADIVVQSAHKMAPAMTMAAYLHINSAYVNKERVEHYYQMLQSSSPSYPIMASLDVARFYLQNFKAEQMTNLQESIDLIKSELEVCDYVKVLETTSLDDPLKITLETIDGVNASEVARLFEKEGIYPELVTTNQILLIVGLEPYIDLESLKKSIKSVNKQLILQPKHDTINKYTELFISKIQTLHYAYNEMRSMETKIEKLEEAIGEVAAEQIIPYPPGIPLIAKGEKITKNQVDHIVELLNKGVSFQPRDVKKGIRIFL